MKATRITFCILLAIFIWTAGCVTQNSDPLTGWTFRTFDEFLPIPDRHNYHLDKSVTDDYQDFIAKNKLNLLGAITGFFEDGTGQHAVEFEAFSPNQNAAWHYVLIYDKESKRIKVIKYGYHRFQS